MSDAPHAIVLGSVHMDLIAEAHRLPGPGDTIPGGAFTMAPGGKAGNQAAQLARAGVQTKIISRLGRDGFGETLSAAIADLGVDVSTVIWDDERPTGASIVMSDGEEYASIVASGAAAAFSLEERKDFAAAMPGAAALVVQFELPASISLAAAEAAQKADMKIVLNASPMPDKLDPDQAALIAMTDILVMNRVEAARLMAADKSVLESGIDLVIITLGDQGVTAFAEGAPISQAAFAVESVDPVGAGDAFLGAFLAATLAETPLQAALERGAAAGALAVGRRGALTALPTAAEIDAFLEARLSDPNEK